MTDEERQRQMDFILESQAQFAANAQRLGEADQRAAARVGRLERVVKLAIRAGLRERRDTREKINALIDSQQRTEAALTRLAEAQAHTDTRLDALIDIVREGRNGKG